MGRSKRVLVVVVLEGVVCCLAAWVVLGVGKSHAKEWPSPHLVWDANPASEEVTGYILFAGRKSRAETDFVGYEAQRDVGSATDYVFVLPKKWRAPVYFAAIAYNRYGMRSEYSDEAIIPEVKAPGIRLSIAGGVITLEGVVCGDCDGDGDIDGTDLETIRYGVAK